MSTGICESDRRKERALDLLKALHVAFYVDLARRYGASDLEIRERLVHREEAAR